MGLCRWTGEQKGIDGEISPPVCDFPQAHHVPDVMVRSTLFRGLCTVKTFYCKTIKKGGFGDVQYWYFVVQYCTIKVSRPAPLGLFLTLNSDVMDGCGA